MVDWGTLSPGYVGARLLAVAILVVAAGLVVLLAPELGTVPALVIGLLFAAAGEFALLAVYGLGRRSSPP